MTKDAYRETIDRIEPDVAAIDASAFYASAAISLKRIADALEKLADDDRTQYRWNMISDTIYSAIVRAK